MAAISALTTVSLMGYSISIPDWLIGFLVVISVISMFSFVCRKFYRFFCSLKNINEEELPNA